MSPLNALFPPDPARAAARAGMFSMSLAAVVLLLFQRSAFAGTESPLGKAAVVASLGAAGFLLVAGHGRMWTVLVAAATLAGGTAISGGWWILAFAAAVLVYAGISRIPRRCASPVPEPEVATDALRDAAEAVGSALVLALIAREFAFETFKIPTGSMEPTIRGNAFAGQSPDGSPRHTGDQLLAFKPMPLLRDPERWEVWVFHCPHDRPTNYIKRIVGIAGDLFAIRGTDIYVNGRIAAKPDTVQEAVWIETADSSAPRAGGGGGRGLLNGHLHADGGESGWTEDDNAARFEAAPGDTLWIAGQQAPFDDKRVTVTAQDVLWSDGSALLVELDHPQGATVLEIGAESATVAAPGIGPVTIGLRGRDLGGSFEIALSVADRIVRVQHNGRTIARIDGPDVPGGSGARPDHGAAYRLGARGVRGAVTRIRVEKDLYYSAGGAVGTSEMRIPADSFIALGDNVSNSQDSRAWRVHVVETRTGVYHAPDSARLNESDSQPRRTFFEHPDRIELRDIDGVQRTIPREDVIRVKRDTPAPFVTRSDLIGPAFLIFAPAVPGYFRPRIVR